MEREEEKLDAAEYVIGTLSGAERAAFEVVVNNDPQARKDVAYWERLFGSMSASIAPEIPDARIWDRISANLPASGSVNPFVSSISEETRERTRAAVIANDNHIAMTKSRGRWRLGAIAASLVALLVGGSVLNDRFNPAPEQVALGGEQYIAVVNASADQPALIVKVDGKTGNVTIRSFGMDRPEGKSLELWYVPEGQKAVSVGLVGEGDIDLGQLTANDGDLLAISLEPQGGSPTGTATGPVIYTGKLIKDVE